MREVEVPTESERGNGEMVITSCHDDSLLALLCSLYGEEIREAKLNWPPYASYMAFEPWKEAQSDQRYVRVMYNGEPLRVFGGDDRIALDELEEKWSDLTADGSVCTE